MERWREFTSRQWGVVARRQLRVRGLSEDEIWRLLKNGTLIQALPAVYRLAGTAANWHQRLMAACLWGGEEAVASHRSAGALFKLDGFPEEPLEITTPRIKHLPGRFRAHRGVVPPAFTTRREGIPVTNAKRTVWDLAGVLEGDRREQMFDEARRRGLVTLEAMATMLERESPQGRKGGRALRAMIDARDPSVRPPASELQRRVRNLLIGAGITDFVEEYVVLDEEGRFVGRVDFGLLCDGEVELVVEAEGRADHSSEVDFNRDLARRNKLTAEVLPVLHITARDMKDPEEWLVRLKKTRERLRARREK